MIINLKFYCFIDSFAPKQIVLYTILLDLCANL